MRGGHHEHRRLGIRRRDVAAGRDASRHLDEDRAGTDLAGLDEGATGKLESLRDGNVDRGEAVRKAPEVWLEMENASIDHFDDLVQGIAKDETAIERVDPGLGPQQYRSVEADEFLWHRTKSRVGPPSLRVLQNRFESSTETEFSVLRPAGTGPWTGGR